METTIHNKSQVLRELEIFVNEEELKNAFDKAFRDLRPKLNLPGFRPGKAPLAVIKKLHGDAIEGETLEKLAQEKFAVVVEEQKIEPIGRPMVTDLHRHAGEGAHFKIAYEVRPEIILQDFAGTEIEQPIFEVTDKDVDERIHYLQFSYATRDEVQKITDKEFIVSLTFNETESNADGEMEPEHSTDVYLYDPQVVEKLRDALIGTSVGDTLILDLPKVVGDGESRDTPVVIKIDKALKVTLPELTEEFCKKISRDKAATELEVRLLTREELEANAKTNSAQALEANMVEALLKKHEFEVPNTITYALIDAMIQEARESNKQKGLPEDTNIDVDEYRQRAWAQAQVRGKWLLLRDTIVEAEKIDATPEDIDALAEKDAAAYGIKKENLLTYYRKNEEVLERIKSEKLVQVLKEKFVIKEKTIRSPTSA